LSRWHELQAVGLLSFHFAHSEYLELVFAGGLVGLALFTAAQTVLIRTLLRGSAGLLPAGPAAVLAVLGLTEVVWNPLTVDGFSWMLVAALLLASAPRPLPASPEREKALEDCVRAPARRELLAASSR
jgi:O-antigen ligase